MNDELTPLKNPLKCPRCDNYGVLNFEMIKLNEQDVTIKLEMPYYLCTECNNRYSHEEDNLIAYAKEKVQERNVDLKLFCPGRRFDNYELNYCDDFKFIYDSKDYTFITGLKREHNIGALTPVFFDISLLLHYIHHSDYRVRQASFSNVIISKGGVPLIRDGFGINWNGKLFTWLCDLYEAFSNHENKEHFLRFLASNIKSDHDIVSEFYFSQIEANFIEVDNERKIFNEKNRFEQLIDTKFSVILSKLEIRDLQEEFRIPVQNDKVQVFNAYIILNNAFVENLNNSNLKQSLQAHGVTKDEIKGKKGLKLFETFLEKVLGFSDSSSIVSPLFVLYDLRILAGHLHEETEFKDAYDNCKARLSQALDINFIDFYKVVVNSLIDMYKDLNSRLS